MSTTEEANSKQIDRYRARADKYMDATLTRLFHIHTSPIGLIQNNETIIHVIAKV